MDCSPPGSSVHGILQARVLEWGAIAFFRHENEFFLNFFFFFAACGVLVPRPGIEPTTPAVEAWSLTLGHQGSPFLKFLHPIFLACSILLLAQMYPQLETINYAPLVFFLCPYSSIHIITNAS